jgi:hypothetical protein
MAAFMDYRNNLIEITKKNKTLEVVLEFEMTGNSWETASEWCARWTAKAVAYDFWFDFDGWGYDIKECEWATPNKLRIIAEEKHKTAQASIPEITDELKYLSLEDGLYEGGDDNNFWVVPDSFFEEDE